LEAELGRPIELSVVKQQVLDRFSEIFQVDFS